MSSDTITSTLRCEVVKPLSMSWDDLGRSLRALRAPLHRVLNTTVSELELMHGAVDRGIPAAHWDSMVKSRKPRAPLDHAHPQSVAYQLVLRTWKAERTRAAERISAGKPYKGDDAIADIAPHTSLVLGSAGLAYTRWKKYRDGAWRGEASLPTFKSEPALCVASSGEAVRLRAQDGSFVLSLQLIAGRKVEIVVRPYGGSGFADMRRLIEGIAAPEDAPSGVKLGDCRVVETDDRGKRKWQAMIAWTRPAPATARGTRVMAVCRGVRVFLACVVADASAREARFWSVDGGKIIEHKRAYDARRSSLGRNQRTLGRGGRGHGKARRLESVERLEHSEANWARARCQEAAAHLCEYAQRHDVGTILLEDWNNPAAVDGMPNASEYIERLVRRWPFAQLKEAILWAAKKRGLSVEERGCAGNRTRCPLCRQCLDDRPGDVFRCPNPTCRLERPSDMVEAWNMLIDAGAATGEKLNQDHKRAVKRAQKRIVKQ